MHRSAAKTFFAALCAISLTGALSACSILSPEISPVATDPAAPKDTSVADSSSSFRPVMATGEPGAALRVLESYYVRDADITQALDDAKALINTTVAVGYADVLEEFPNIADQFLALDCSIPLEDRSPQVDNPAEPLVACDVDGMRKYLLAPTEIGSSSLTSVQTVNRDGYWAITLEFTDDGAQALKAVTSRLTNFPEARSPLADSPDADLAWLGLSSESAFKQLAIVGNALVLSAPQVMSPIPDGVIDISGSFTEESAEELAELLSD
ncbi:SecDF P1 head subdomain-containing protein [Lysinibacter cavernae]|uniref:SecDF P1 head subdomain domain-containing protein n=1 Tax=Lysinibacter cavernae TaxID=1640652 RepID=A0A7X5R0I9_9MICO|nr:hypothetical protein [Lysinibacter cavernae]NIH53262.1 hypothetical protein [Lysinibacter cavernae]